MDDTRLILIRHGESVAQVEGFVGGHEGCRGLSDRGRAQVQSLTARIRQTDELADAAAVYTSLMPRAAETAELLVDALGDLTVKADCDFCEHHPGEGDGLAWEVFNERYPVPEEGWHPDLRRDTGGETWNEMAARVARGLDALVERHPGETVVVACHGGVVVHSMLRWLAIDHRFDNGDRAWFTPENTSITEWCYGAPPWGSQRPGWQLVRFNDHAHLLTP